MKTKVQKKSELSTLKEKLPSSTITIFTTFSRQGAKGLSVAQMQELKRALRQLHAEYLIAKKSLTDIAVRDLHYDGVDVFGMAGSLGIVIGPPLPTAADGRGNDDAYAIAKKLYEFAKKNDALKMFGAYFDGKFMDGDQFIEMAKLPSKNDLIARLLGMMRYPLSSLAIVLKQISEAKERSAPASAPAEIPAAVPSEATPVTESTNQ